VVTAIVPAYNEAGYIGETLAALHAAGCFTEIVVVDDGSRDDTGTIAREYARVIRHPQNWGKGAAIATGMAHATSPVVCWVDADLGKTAVHVRHLLPPVLNGEADMTIAQFPPPRRKEGFGIVVWTASRGIYHLTGRKMASPLSGQRAMRRDIFASLGPYPRRFGLEVGITVQLLRSGYRLQEVPLPLSHRRLGRNWRGMVHRGRELIDVVQTLWELYRQT
jgi:glycosyltransferase involved in cell wall biosynthesis